LLCFPFLSLSLKLPFIIKLWSEICSLQWAFCSKLIIDQFWTHLLFFLPRSFWECRSTQSGTSVFSSIKNTFLCNARFMNDLLFYFTDLLLPDSWFGRPRCQFVALSMKVSLLAHSTLEWLYLCLQFLFRASIVTAWFNPRKSWRNLRLDFFEFLIWCINFLISQSRFHDWSY
jgi:hypothetical protein